MKTYIYHPLILLVIILVTVSCENELPFNIKDNPPKLVMNAFINADSLTNVLFLNLTGKDYANHIENATVEVHVNGELPCAHSRWKLSMTSNAGSTSQANLLREK